MAGKIKVGTYRDWGDEDKESIKSKERSAPITRSRLKKVTKKVPRTAIVAGGLAVGGTPFGDLNPDEKERVEDDKEVEGKFRADLIASSLQMAFGHPTEISDKFAWRYLTSTVGEVFLSVAFGPMLGAVSYGLTRMRESS